MPYIRARPEGIVYVLAPSYRHFRTWCRDNGRSAQQMLFCPEAVYLHTPSKAEGVRAPRVARVEGWEGGRHAREIWWALVGADAVSYPDGTSLADLDYPFSEEAVEALNVLPEATRRLTESLGRVSESMGYVGQTASQISYSMIQAAMQPAPQYNYYGGYTDEYGALRNCPCRDCCERRARAEQPLPPAPPGESYVYFADGPAAGQRITLPDQHDRYMAADPPGPFSEDMLLNGPVLPTHTTYAIVSYPVCGQLGPHELTGVCSEHIRVGFSTYTTVPLVLGQYRERTLDALVPGWRALVTGGSAVPAHGRIQDLPAGAPREIHVRIPREIQQDFEAQARNYYNYYVRPGTPQAYGVTLRQVLRQPEPVEPVDAPDEEGWYRPVAQRELNWTEWDESEDGTTVCAHVCGGDHQCDARATTEMTFDLPTGGKRVMPVCGTCYEAETADEGAAR